MTDKIFNATKNIWFPVIIAGLALGITVWSSLYLVSQQNVANVKNCANVLVLRDAVTDIVKRGQRLAEINPSLSPGQHQNAAAFYEQAQKDLQHVLCKQ